MRPFTKHNRLQALHHHHTIAHYITASQSSIFRHNKLGNFHQLQFSTSINSDNYRPLKDEYASSPFRSKTGTSIDPLFDPDSIAHSVGTDTHNQKRKHLCSQHKDTLQQMKSDTTTHTIEDNDSNNDSIKQLPLSAVLKRIGWKKRHKKVLKYRDRISDPLDKPIIDKKRVFAKGDKCEGCGALLQNEDKSEIGYVESVANNEKEMKKEMESKETEMRDIYIPDHQRLLLMDLGIIHKTQKYLTYEQYRAIDTGNKTANKKKHKKTVLEKAICVRCFQLENYKKIGQIKDNTVVPSQFNQLLTNRFSRNKVNLQQISVIKIVDIFDFHGSFIPNLSQIINANHDSHIQNRDVIKDIPIVLALNKVDLLTSNVRKPANHSIITDWAWNECKRFNFKPHSIVLISCKTGLNTELLLETAIKAAPIKTSLKRHPRLGTSQRYRDIYVIGTTNVGKSTLLNHLLHKKKIYSANNARAHGQLTTSAIPATTLGIIPFMVRDEVNTRLLDTPGVIQSTDLCLKLTDDEYKMLVPKKSVKPLTFKIKSGQSVILGSLARLDCESIEGDNAYFYWTVFVSPMCSVHVTRVERAKEMIALHSGNTLRPINDIERVLRDPSLAMERKQSWELSGIGLQSSVCDVVFPGIGWVALTGKDRIRFTAHAMRDMKVGVRKPLLSRDMYRNVKKYQGIPHKKW